MLYVYNRCPIRLPRIRGPKGSDSGEAGRTFPKRAKHPHKLATRHSRSWRILGTRPGRMRRSVPEATPSDNVLRVPPSADARGPFPLHGLPSVQPVSGLEVRGAENSRARGDNYSASRGREPARVVPPELPPTRGSLGRAAVALRAALPRNLVDIRTRLQGVTASKTEEEARPQPAARILVADVDRLRPIRTVRSRNAKTSLSVGSAPIMRICFDPALQIVQFLLCGFGVPPCCQSGPTPSLVSDERAVEHPVARTPNPHHAISVPRGPVPWGISVARARNTRVPGRPPPMRVPLRCRRTVAWTSRVQRLWAAVRWSTFRIGASEHPATTSDSRTSGGLG